MYRAIDPEPEFEYSDESLGDARLLALESPKEYTDYLSSAATFKALYEFELAGLMRRYNISEVECVGGLMLRSPKARLKVEKDYDVRVSTTYTLSRSCHLICLRCPDRLAGSLHSTCLSDCQTNRGSSRGKPICRIRRHKPSSIRPCIIQDHLRPRVCWIPR